MNNINTKKNLRKMAVILLIVVIVFTSACNANQESTVSEVPAKSNNPSNALTQNTTTPAGSTETSQPSETELPTVEPTQPGTTSSPSTSERPSETPTQSNTPSSTETLFNEEDDVFYSQNLFPVRPEITIVEKQQTQFELTKATYMFEIMNPVELYSSTGPGRPSSLPGDLEKISPVIVLPGMLFTKSPPVYSNGFRNSFVQEGGDEDLWFAWKGSNSNISSIIWQVSDRPFLNSAIDYENPPGLLDSGILEATEKEFSIDFSNIGKFRSELTYIQPGFSLIPPIYQIDISIVDQERVNPKQKIYYVRAFAQDSDGDIIGEPGKGLEILYGNRIDYVSKIKTIKIPFELLFGAHNGPGGPQNEFYNTFLDTYQRTYEPDNSNLLYFRPEGMPSDTDTILIQVCTSQPTGFSGSWRDPAGLVYEVEIKKGEEDFDSLIYDDHGIGVDIKAFAKNPPANYYVRAVALSDGPEAGTVKDVYSKVVFLNYGPLDSQFEYIPPPEVIYLDAGVPDVKFLEYHHHWEADPEWMYYFEVVRQPTYSEYYALLPEMFVNNPNELVEGMTPGTILYTKPEDKGEGSWWDKVKDAISDVFGSIKNFIADITNWVSSAYSDLKADMITFVADNLPLVPEEYRDELKKAMEYMVDYGLASVGIPPELPNFDQLTSMGADYLAATALEQAGIPADEITKDMVKDLGKGIADSASSVAKSGNSPNPFGWNFVRQYPEKMYQPAYILIEVTNNTDEVSPGGTLSGSVFTDISSAELSDPNKMWLSSTFGGTLHFELYRPVHSFRIPQLLPGQTLEIPIFLEKYTGMAYSFSPHVVTVVDFSRLYNQLGEYTFSFSINYDLLPVDEYAAQLGLEPKGRYHVYEYKKSSDSFGFTGLPWVDIE